VIAMLSGPLEWTRLRLLTGKYLCENAHVSVSIESRASLQAIYMS